MTTTATNTTTTNGSTPASNGKTPKQVTAADAINRITKILDQLSPSDRKRTLAFINSETAE